MNVSTNEVLTLLGVASGGGILVSVAAQLLKKYAGLKSKSVIHTLVLGLTAVGAVAQYVISYKHAPAAIAGVSFTSIYAVSQAVYKYSTYAKEFVTKVNNFNSANKVETPVVATTEPSATVASF